MSSGQSSALKSARTFSEAFSFVTSAAIDAKKIRASNDTDLQSMAALDELSNVILVNKRQTGNPVLKHVKNVAWKYIAGTIVPDYILGTTCCALYISLRYHLLHPDYLFRRIKEMRDNYRLRVVLCQVDLEDNETALLEVNKLVLLSKCTLILAWSTEEAARYLETYKSYEHKPANSIKEKIQTEYLPQLTDILTTIRSVNKNDCMTLVSTFGSLRAIMGASMEDLALCPGLGEKKVKRIFDAFHCPLNGSKS